jgi:hypothetical protein
MSLYVSEESQTPYYKMPWRNSTKISVKIPQRNSKKISVKISVKNGYQVVQGKEDTVRESKRPQLGRVVVYDIETNRLIQLVEDIETKHAIQLVEDMENIETKRAIQLVEDIETKCAIWIVEDEIAREKMEVERAIKMTELE